MNILYHSGQLEGGWGRGGGKMRYEGREGRDRRVKKGNKEEYQTWNLK